MPSLVLVPEHREVGVAVPVEVAGDRRGVVSAARQRHTPVRSADPRALGASPQDLGGTAHDEVGVAVLIQVGDRGLQRVVARLNVVRHTEVVVGEGGRAVGVRTALGAGHDEQVEVLRLGDLVHQIGEAVPVEVGGRGRGLARGIDRPAGTVGHRTRAAGRTKDEKRHRHHRHYKGGRHGVPHAHMAEGRTACCRKVHQPTSRP
ncbi:MULTISPECIES: hypothetical protein [unclassified Streptomyces]|uniref:hypothetical protein n=1 Tax=Streptomyces sp. NPDC127532 TaxID=3345399 RepID=UPI00363F5F41